MDNALYVNLSRQTALMRELSTIATNIANMNTSGFRREASVFSEYIKAVDGPVGSLSMTAARSRYADASQGVLTQTNGMFDVAIEGDGYFQVETPFGQRLTRAGAFTPNPQNELVTMEGYRVLNAAGGPVFIPPDARNVSIAPDGSLSADGRLIDQLGMATIDNPGALRRAAGTLLEAVEPVRPATDARIVQGFLESSNVNAIAEVSRMIEVQRAYELGQGLMQGEHDRIEKAIQTMGRAV